MTTIDERIDTEEDILKAIHELDHVTTNKRTSTDANELYCRIMAILTKLPTRQKQVIGYMYLYHLSRKRTADKMGLTIRSVHNLKIAAEESIRAMAREEV